MAADYRDMGGRRFYWDGASYGSPEEAEEAAEKYADDGFEVLVLEAEGGHLVYSRREAQAS